MPSLIKTVFTILGILVAALLMAQILFSSGGQTFMWRAIHPAIERQWSNCTMDNGAERSSAYDELFDKYKD